MTHLWRKSVFLLPRDIAREVSEMQTPSWLRDILLNSNVLVVLPWLPLIVSYLYCGWCIPKHQGCSWFRECFGTDICDKHR
jgi:hypothetical protein